MIDRVRKLLEKIKKEDKIINAFIQVNPDALKEAEEIDRRIKSGKAGKLAGKIIAVKSNINVKGLKATCASKTLENYKSSFDATVIRKIRAEDGLIIGMTNMDEFACGSSGETSAFNPTRNPQSTELVPGGSSSGSAAAVSAGFCDMALGSDTGGSIRNPASHCNVVGMKPSYGTVSRYGLIDLSMSLDQIGPFANTSEDAELLYNIIKGKDDKDATTFELHEKEEKRNLTLALSKDFEKLCSDKRIYDLIRKKTEELCKKKGWKLVNAELKHIDLAVSAYYPICYVEFFSATRRFDGRKYGLRIEEVCGPEVLRRILGGSEISKAEFRGTYYRKALKVKQIIKKELDSAFEKVDAIISPTVPKLPHKIGSKISPEEMYSYDAFTIPANLSEVCAISVPAGKIDNIPVGIQIMCSQFNEKKMFEVAKAFE